MAPPLADASNALPMVPVDSAQHGAEAPDDGRGKAGAGAREQPSRPAEPQSPHLSPHGARAVGKIGNETYSAANFAALEAALGRWLGDEFNPCVVLEVGPNPVLSRMARPWVGSGRVAAWCASLNQQAGLDDVEAMRKAAANLDEHLNKPPTALGALLPRRRVHCKTCTCT